MCEIRRRYYLIKECKKLAACEMKYAHDSIIVRLPIYEY